MNTILHTVQNEIVKSVRSCGELSTFAVVACEFGSLENLREKKFAECSGPSIFISYPMPTKLLENVPLSCFEQIAFELIMSKPLNQINSPNLLAAAEILGEFLPKCHLATEKWATSFSLSKSNPWRELQSNNYHKIKMHFFSSKWILR